MAIVSDIYARNFLIRYDFDIAIPYFDAKDFKNLRSTEATFNNGNGVEIHYFTYFYQPVRFSKVILFLPGIGPGHKAYLREINELALKGYKVITLDYEGCGYSGGERLPSINQPTLDVLDLLSYLKLKEEIVLVGHSLGAYTALNVVNRVNKISKAIIISGFLTPKLGMLKFTKSRLLAREIERYEAQIHPEFVNNNLEYLKMSHDKILFIHSKDDPKVSFRHNINKVKKLRNNFLSFLVVNNKRHNPTYTLDSVKYKDKIMDEYWKRLNKHKFNSDQERLDYFKDVSIKEMTNIDQIVFAKIINFIG